MQLFLTALDQQANHRGFGCEIPFIETGFDFLSTIVAQGHTLLSVYVVEDNHRTDLPLAAFDGLPFSAVIKALQQEWQAVLIQPLSLTPTHKQEMIALTRRRIDQYHAVQATHERMIQCCTSWLQRSQQGKEGSSLSLMHHYERIRTTHQHQLANVQFSSQVMASRLSRLMA